MSNAIRTEVVRTAVSLDKIYQADFQKEGTLTAQIRQEVNTHSYYPSKKVDSNMQQNIFDAGADFGFHEKEFNSKETRVAWIPVPKDAKEADIVAKLAAASSNGACIYKTLSSAPILDDNQKYAISQGFKTMDDFADAQVVRYPDGHSLAGQLILDHANRVQYRRTFFWKTPQEDQDIRGKVEVYQSKAIKAELEGASIMQGQTI